MKPRSAILALFLALLCAMLSPMAPAKAASSWDTVLNGSATTVVSTATGSADIGTQLVYLMDNVIGWGLSSPSVSQSACMARVASFKNAVQNPESHYWGLFQAKSGDTRYLTLRWTDDTTNNWITPQGTTTPYFRISGASQFITFWYDSSTTSSKAPIPNSYVGPYAACSGINNPRIVDLAASQYGSSTSYGLPVYVTGGIQYPVGYEGYIVPQTWSPPTPTYVAMGDSFSSGEGNPPFESGTDTNTCHRSPAAYPRLLEAELGPADFVACSGATTDDVILNQMSALSEDTEVVTITIGGNDVGFSTFALNCVLVSCSEISQGYANVMEAINGDLQNSLETVYWMILGASGDATVYVVGYPYLTGDSANGDCQTFEIVSDLGARAVTDALNAKIYSAVENVKDDVLHPDYENRLVYVPANSNDESSPFDGSFICSSPSLYNGIDYSHQEYSFHPNSAGHAAYATLLSGS